MDKEALVTAVVLHSTALGFGKGVTFASDYLRLVSSLAKDENSKAVISLLLDGLNTHASNAQETFMDRLKIVVLDSDNVDVDVDLMQ